MASTPRIRRTDLKVPHPTATKLLDTAIELLESIPMDEITISEVLTRSGVSYGSLYYHYEDFADLVEQAVAHRFSSGHTESVATVVELLECTEATEFQRRFEDLLVQFHARARRPFRLERVKVIGAMEGHPRLAARIAHAQQQANDGLRDCLAEFQRRGWLRDDFDAEAQAMFIAATFLGRAVDDIVERPIDEGRWSDVALAALRAVLLWD